MSALFVASRPRASHEARGGSGSGFTLAAAVLGHPFGAISGWRSGALGLPVE